MKRVFLFCCFMSIYLLSNNVQAQDGVNIKDNEGNVLMEIRENGVLIRKLTTAQRQIFTLPASDNGLLVYDTDTKSFWVWKDDRWMELDSDVTNELPTTPQAGDITYYDGTSWQRIPAGIDGQVLTMSGGVPTWTTSQCGCCNSLIEVTLSNSETIFLHPKDNVHPSDNGDKVSWGPFIDLASLPNITDVNDAITDLNGEQSTTDIINEIDNNLGGFLNGSYAAKLCDDLEAFGFDNWYLPSAGELKEIWDALQSPVDNFNLCVDVELPQGLYYSTTEVQSNTVWGMQFGPGSTGIPQHLGKGDITRSHQFRCIRKNNL